MATAGSERHFLGVSPLTWGVGFSTKPELDPLVVVAWLACPYGGGGTHCKGLLSHKWQAGPRLPPQFEGGKADSAVVMPPQAHRELQGKTTKHSGGRAARAAQTIVPVCLPSQAAGQGRLRFKCSR